MLKYPNGRMVSFGLANGLNESEMLFESEGIFQECIKLINEKYGEWEFLKNNEQSSLVALAQQEAHSTSNAEILFRNNFWRCQAP